VPGTQPDRRASTLLAVSSAITSLHKEQFGCQPVVARSHFAGADTLVCVLEDALLPAERASVQMGEAQRVRESRGSLQAATARCFVETVEQLTGRTVYSFASATDPERGVVTEVFIFESLDGEGAGGPHDSVRAETAALVRDSDRMRAEDAQIRRNLDVMRLAGRDGARLDPPAAYAGRPDRAPRPG
jgi:uncharacterized protein YbcI